MSDSVSNGKQPILIDLDGFFKPLVEAENSFGSVRDYSKMLPTTPVEVHRICQVHFLFRSAYNLTADSGAFAGIEDLSRISLLRAVVACSSNDFGVLKIPDWADFFCNSVKRIHGKQFPSVHEATLHVDLRPRLHAWSVPRKQEVHISALTRELLLRINVLLVNASDYFESAKSVVNRDVSVQAADYIVAYLAASFYDLNYSRLPVARAHSAEHFHKAMLITQMQVEFMISHEFGHLVQDLGGLNLVDRENRCDDFAFGVVKQAESISQVFTALRWLFIIMSLERLLGEILYNASDTWTDDVDWLQEKVRARDRTPQIFAENEAHDVLNWTETAGSLLLFSVKGHLHEIGPGGVRQMVAKIREDAALPSPQDMREFVGRALATLRETANEEKSADA